MRLALLALRNLARNRRRTAISLAVVATGTAALLLTAGFMAFSFEGLAEAMIHGGLGHLEIALASAAEGRTATLERSAAEGLDDWQEVQARVEALEGVLAASPTLHVAGMASTDSGRSAAFLGVAGDPVRERRMGFSVKLRAGQPMAEAPPREGEDQVMVAQGLAQVLGIGPGSRLTLLAVDPDGMLNALDVTVAGVITTGVQELDTRFVRLHLGSAQRLLSTSRVSNLLVTLDTTSRTETMAARMGELLAGHEPPLAVVPWTARAPFYAQVRALYAGIFWFLGSIVFALVVLATSNTLTMTVMERFRELGTLRALGTSVWQVAALVGLEAVWLGLLGGVAGDLLGAGLIAVLNGIGLEMPPPPGAVDPVELRVLVVPEAFGGAIVLMLGVLLLAAVGPVLRVARLRIVEALAHT
ncbi:MAG TPA: ABC transporter permease [Thermoanaerobaculaceae bacterium]|nr:ABC transporter permease [Thermoanaerobaculaceae bacterium]HRS15649.1 ABC transporter permease [Thermoanaerobaculaceae bacterium]